MAIFLEIPHFSPIKGPVAMTLLLFCGSVLPAPMRIYPKSMWTVESVEFSYVAAKQKTKVNIFEFCKHTGLTFMSYNML